MQGERQQDRQQRTELDGVGRRARDAHQTVPEERVDVAHGGQTRDGDVVDQHLPGRVLGESEQGHEAADEREPTDEDLDVAEPGETVVGHEEDAGPGHRDDHRDVGGADLVVVDRPHHGRDIADPDAHEEDRQGEADRSTG